MIDGLGFERQFIDHGAPVWAALPERGRFLTDSSLVAHARSRGIDADEVDAPRLRATSLPPTAWVEDGPIALAFSIGDIKIGRRLGYRRFVFGEHGIGQSYAGARSGLARHPSYAGGMDREDVGLFLVPNETCAQMWRAAYPSARVEVVGCPRLDDLPVRDPDGRTTVAISFHWPAHVSPEADTAIGYYAAALRRLGEKFHVIGHAHPKGDWPERMRRIYRRAGIPFVADFDDVCRQADVYVCDNSSTIYEFASTGRPVVVLNSPVYRRNVNHGLRFDWGVGTNVGVQVNDPANLVDLVRLALTDPPKYRAAREAALDLVYAHRSGGAARAAAAITEWLGVSVAA